jgi:hypothetical protein
MLVPAFQPLSVLPARKYSVRERDAWRRARNPAVTAYAMKARTMSASIMVGQA